MCYGIPLGSEEYMSHQVQQRAKEIIDDSKQMVEVLSGNRQTLWAMLYLSTLSRFKYFCQLDQLWV